MILNIPSDNSELIIKWNNDDDVIKYLSWQRETAFRNISKENFESHLNKIYSSWWQGCIKTGIYKGLPASPRILDVGSGLAIFNLLAYQHLGHAKIFLLDKEEISHSGVYFSPQTPHGFYHNWNPVKDAINTTQIPIDDIIFMSPEDNWPSDLDLITSYGSWCWHYELDTYWKKAKESLKIGGKITLEISNNVLQYENVVKRISEEFNSYPILHLDIEKSNDEFFKDCIVNNNVIGKKCSWIRRK